MKRSADNLELAGNGSNDGPSHVHELQKAVEFHEAVLASMGEGLYTLDPNGRIMAMNPAAERLLGVKLSDVKGRSFHQVAHYLRPDGSPYPEDECATFALLTNGQPVSEHEDVFVRGDGTQFDTVLSSSPVVINGESVAVVVVFRDVSEERKIAADLQANEARMRIAVEAADQVTWEWDLDQDIVYWNDRKEELLGPTRLENPARAEDFFDVLHVEDLESVRTALFGAVAEKEPIDLVFRTLRRDNTYRSISVYGRVTEWDGDRAVRLSGVASDVTERRAAEEALIASQKKLLETLEEQKKIEENLRRKAALIELSKDPIFVWDPSEGIVEWNKGAEALYGYSSAEALGRTSHELLRTEHPGGLAEFYKRIEKEGYWSGQLKHYTKEGHELIIESRQQLIESGDRSVVLETNRDVTEHQRAESLLQRYRLLAESSRDAIWFLSKEYEFVEVNQAAIDLYGYSRQEFLSMTLKDLRHPSTIGDLPAQFKQADETGIHFETVHVKKDGSILQVDVTANGAEFGGERLVLAIVRDITDRKRAEDALRESEERRKLAQNAGRVGVFDWDAVAGKTYWSETMWRFYGELPDGHDPNHEFWLSHLHPSDQERVDLNIADTLRSDEENFRDEFRVIKKDGSVRWIEAIAKVTRDENGSPLRMYGVNLDITERKETEERIRLSENQLRLVTNAVPALISYVDNNERYRFVNQQFHEWFGLSAEELVGRKIKDVIGAQAYRTMKPRIDEALSGKQVSFETSLTYKVAGNRYVHISYMPDIGVDGTVYGYYGLTNDLTELKRSEDLLRSTQERIGMLMESMTDYAIFSLDAEGILDTWNTGAELIFGCPASEAIGKPGDTLFAPEDIARGVPSKELRTARKDGRAYDERWLVRRDGTKFFASTVTMPLYLGSELSGYAKIASDLTEKKRRAEELQRAHDELELRVKERTRELAEANLALIQEMEVREKAERQRIDLLGRLVASQEVERKRIARDLHDSLGQRLTALRLKIASLKDVCADLPDIAPRVERLQEIGEKIDEGVSFLAWELRPTALDDLGLVKAVGAFVNEWSLHYEIAADFHTGGLTNIRLDHDTETHLYRITQEALNNITKHANASYVTVMLEKREKDVLLIIEDNGTGFDPAAARDPDGSGRGLGLIGMNERAALIGGALEVESSKRGTTLYVRVPLNQ